MNLVLGCGCQVILSAIWTADKRTDGRCISWQSYDIMNHVRDTRMGIKTPARKLSTINFDWHLNFTIFPASCLFRLRKDEL